MAGKGGKREGAGRKIGSPNTATAAIRALASEHAEKAISTLVDLMGSYAALELEIPLSKLEPKDAIATISDAAATGTISLDEGQKLIGMVEARIKAIELAEIEARLDSLEGNNTGKATR